MSTTPNMSLLLPGVGTDTGYTWESGINSNASILDGHNHTPGSGVQIPPAGLIINTNLPFNDNSATGVQGVTYTPQTANSTLLSTYVIGNDLYYTDGAGNVVRITSGGTVNATSSGIASGSATASFSSGVLVVDSASNTPANIQAGSLLIGQNTAGSNFLTLSPPSALSSGSYTVVLPTIPVSQSFLSIDASGNIAPYAAVSGGITGNMIAAATVSRSNLTASGALQSSPGSASTSSGSWTNTGIQQTLTTYGNPVLVVISGNFFASHAGTGVLGMNVGIGIAGSIYSTLNQADIYDTVGSLTLNFPLAGSQILILGAGTYTFGVFIQSFSSAITAYASGVSISVYELK